MDAKTEDTRSATPVTGLDTVRARAQREKRIRLQRTGPNDALALRCSWQKLKTLKDKSTDDLPAADAADGLLSKLWSGFQHILGNR